MVVGTRRIKGGALVAATVMVVSLGVGGTARAAQLDPAPTGSDTGRTSRAATLPGGWTLAGDVLTWSSPSRIPMGGARVQATLDGHDLGPAVVSPDGRSVSVRLSPAVTSDPTIDWSGLDVVASGRRLDGGSTVKLQARTAGPALAAVATPPPGALLTHDPGKAGPYRTVTGSYSLPGVTIAGLSEPVEVKAVVVSPRGTTGPRPLVLFLHGRHETCYRGADQSTGDWPCPAGFKPIPSHRGYLETQQLLASQGYDTVSISANGINGQDWILSDGGAEARSELIRHHLALWQAWSTSDAARDAAPAVVRAAPRADLSKVLLVGHSRGGEGVNRAALDSTTGTPAPWTIRGLVHIGPTAFGQNPAPGVPVVVLLPYCDGDVSDLQGQAYVDAARDVGNDPVLRSAVLVFGANHNFFNSEWTPGDAVAPAWDDWGDDTDRVCGPREGSSRLTPSAQRAVGTTYTAAAAALFLRSDRKVLPLLDGSKTRVASAGSARVLTHALGERRTTFLVPTSTTSLSHQGSVAARLCRTAEAEALGRECVPDAEWGSTPHFLPLYYLHGEPSRRALEVSWTKATGRARVDLATPRSLATAASLDLRIAVPAGAAKATFAIRLTDGSGHHLVLPDTSLTGLPADPRAYSGKTWAQDVRLPLNTSTLGNSRIDLGAIARVDVVPRSGKGQLWLLDAWGWRGGLSTAKPLAVPRLDVGALTVDEGSTDQTVRLPITVTGPAATAGRAWVVVIDPTSFEAPQGHLVQVPAGATQFTVDIPVPGDHRDDPDVLLWQVAVKTVRGLAVGDYIGGLTVTDDDPSPTLTIVPVATNVEEGDDLVWRLQLSDVTDLGVFVQLTAEAPGAGLPPEVNTRDLPTTWLQEHEVDPSGPPRLLSDAYPFVYAYIEVGTDSIDVVVPTKKDRLVEGAESIAFSITDSWGATLPDPVPRLLGRIHDPT